MVYQSDETGTVGQGSYSSSAYLENSHYVAVCHGWEVGGTCNFGTGQYALNTSYCGGGWMCGYDLETVIDQNYTVFASGSFKSTNRLQTTTILEMQYSEVTILHLDNPHKRGTRFPDPALHWEQKYIWEERS
ncbi:hypothetical protein LEP1GSC038_4854 [Leptospira weilii str. 2006001855]|uniref:Uncharacterized protein n=1 Tax=Leptospira weilii str. 2006001855 TaxID=996804 RepID=M6FIJ7_9LEPT|nr:hypothetical protein LEP1GSC038_4854 [Leptospira weilii str. 2006001855]